MVIPVLVLIRFIITSECDFKIQYEIQYVINNLSSFHFYKKKMTYDILVLLIIFLDI